MRRFREQGRLAFVVASLLTTVLYNNCAPFGNNSGAPASILAVSEVPEAPPGDAAFRFQCQDSGVRGTSEQNARRLTKPQLAKTLGDLVGKDTMADTAIQTQLKLLTDDVVINSVLDVADAPPDTEPAAMLEIAMRISEITVNSPTKLKAVFGDCASATITDACMQTFISNFGLRVFRRPLSTTEASALMSFYKMTGGSEGTYRVLARLLMSPSLVYHIETGSAIEGGRLRLTDYEVASRLSYRLIGTMPDQALFDAAKAGQLQDLATVRTHAARLLTTVAGKDAVTDFFRYYMREDTVPMPNAFAAKLDGVDPTTIRSEMLQELHDYVGQVVWTKAGRFADLFTSNQVFPKSASMASLLETSGSNDGTASTASADHSGLLLRPAFLAASGQLTNPYHRALIVRSNLLCETFSAPDPNAVSGRQTALGDLSGLSNRDRLFALTNTPACLGCHGKLNPVAFVLEGYDQLGKKRAVESVFDSTGIVTQTHTINTAVTDTFISDAIGPVNSFNAAADLQRAIASGTSGRACFARRVFEFQRARAMTDSDSCALRDIEYASSSAGSVKDAFISSVANADIFYKAKGN